MEGYGTLQLLEIPDLKAEGILHRLRAVSPMSLGYLLAKMLVDDRSF